ncbi:MAG: glycosyltransferase [Chloroflexi bacterium]|nr:glycosyltransferase [Chloroflexota bacterium]
MSRHRVLLAGGGSGGSVTPALAVAEQLRALEPDVGLLFVGTRGGPESDLVAAADIPYHGLSSGKLRRYLDVQNLVDPFKVAAGLAQSAQVARAFRPTVAFGAGGFAAVPPLLAARLLGTPLAIHQLDAEPGLANRLLAPFAAQITVTLPGSMDHFPPARTRLAGCLVREAVLRGSAEDARANWQLDPSAPLVLVTGGGTGALGLNRLIVEALPLLLERCSVVHLTGRGRAVPASLDSPRYRAVEFVTGEMADLLAAADLVVSRAGMGTLTELAVLSKPALLIPMPASHQAANAMALARAGGGRPGAGGADPQDPRSRSARSARRRGKPPTPRHDAPRPLPTRSGRGGRAVTPGAERGVRRASNSPALAHLEPSPPARGAPREWRLALRRRHSGTTPRAG